MRTLIPFSLLQAKEDIMRKISAILGTMLLTFFLANSAIAQSNLNAYFAIDTDLATSGFQTSPQAVTGIGPTAQVGFALYSQAWDSAKGFTVHFEWDGALAVYRSASSLHIVDNDITINGASITPPAETNIIGAATLEAGEINTTGKYEISKAQSGSVSASTTAVGLIYFFVLRTVATFNTQTPLTVSASVTVADANAATRFLGTRYFYVNQEIDVKTSSWGEVKKQFKDF